MSARYAVIGDPIAHSLSPAMHEAAFRSEGIDATYEALRVSTPGLASAFARLRAGFAGFNATTPHKEPLAALVDELTADARAARAVNAVRIDGGRTTGHNTDGAGFVAALDDTWGLAPRGLSACLLGSGPAARAIALALRSAGAARVRCWSRNSATAREIGEPPDARPDLLVCALPAEASVPDDILRTVAPADYVFDVNYRVGRSPVAGVVAAHRSDGLPLLLHQGALSFRWWTGRAAPLDVMRAALQRADN